MYPKDNTPNYELFLERLKSFANWSGPVGPIELIFNGFSSSAILLKMFVLMVEQKFISGKNEIHLQMTTLNIRLIALMQNGGNDLMQKWV